MTSMPFGVYWDVYHTQCIIRQRSCQAERRLVSVCHLNLSRFDIGVDSKPWDFTPQIIYPLCVGFEFNPG